MNTHHLISCLALGLTCGCTLDLPRDTEFEFGERADQGLVEEPLDSGTGMGGAVGRSHDAGAGGFDDAGQLNDAGAADFNDFGAGGDDDAGEEGAGGSPMGGADAGGGAQADGGLGPTNPLAAFPDIRLVGYWGFDEREGEWAEDRSGNRHHGHVHPGADWITAGKRGGALGFDGRGLVDVGAFDVPGEGMTLTAWVYLDGEAEPDASRIISKAVGSDDDEHHWMLSLRYLPGEDGPHLRFRVRTSGPVGERTDYIIGDGPTVPSNRWVHAAATYDGEFMSVYLNGQLTGRRAKTGPIAADPQMRVLVGSNPDQFGPWVGALDEVAVLARALRPEEVCRLAEVDDWTCSGFSSSPE